MFYQRTSKVDTADLGDAIGQRGLKTLAKLLEASGLVEGPEIPVPRKPCVSGGGEKDGRKGRIPHRLVFGLVKGWG